MKREEICTRENVIKRLQEIGANPKFLKMPAIIERIVNDDAKLSSIEVDANGNISYSATKLAHKVERTFKLQPDGTVKSGELGKIDQYGMEVESGYKALGGIRRNGKIDIITFTNVADSYTTTYDNYPGWEIEGVKTAQTEDNVLIIGHMIAKYPETENWFVENGFLSPEKDIRDKEIAEAIQAAKANNEAMLQEQKDKLDAEKNNRRDARLDDMDAARGGVLEHMFSLGRQPKEERIQGLLLNIEVIEKEIEEYNKLIEIYSQGERPAEDISYTEEQAVQNRIEYYRKQTEIYSSKAQEMKAENEAKAEKIARLQELAKRCTKIPFVGKKVLQTYNEQITMLQEGQPTREVKKEDEEIDAELDEAYRSYMDAYMEHTEAQETTRKYSEAFKSLKSCILELGRVPFIGKRILREMEEMTEEKNNDTEQREEDEER